VIQVFPRSARPHETAERRGEGTHPFGCPSGLRLRLGVPGAGRRSVQFAGKRASQRTEGVRAMTEYLIAAILFVAMVTTLVYLWKREHS